MFEYASSSLEMYFFKHFFIKAFFSRVGDFIFIFAKRLFHIKTEIFCGFENTMFA